MNDIGAWGFTYPLLFLPKSKWQDLDAGTRGHTPFLTGKAEVLGGTCSCLGECVPLWTSGLDRHWAPQRIAEPPGMPIAEVEAAVNSGGEEQGGEQLCAHPVSGS